ncbi:hypothetical protein OCQ_10860 [Mycobacterium paraintracellulare]|nr:hypothetical protein OCQ_10860 [Mycobacterium paraintracellulare]OSC21216.1 hydroxylamine reductase [Mycobacterium paraintracellulare]
MPGAGIESRTNSWSEQYRRLSIHPWTLAANPHRRREPVDAGVASTLRACVFGRVSRCPQSDSNRHLTDFKSALPGDL